MSTLGERIRQLRKQRGKTLAEVAEGRLTKGMLSLIENNKAQPSVESLTHIAESLGTDMQSLLADVNVITQEELRQLAEQLKALLKEYRYEDLSPLLTPFAGMTLPKTYEAARFVRDLAEAYYFHSQSLQRTETSILLSKKEINRDVDHENWRSYFENAEERFTQLSFFDEAANTALEYIQYLTYELEYEEALALFNEKQATYSEQLKDLDPFTLAKWNFQEVALLMITGQKQIGSARLKEALSFAIEKRQFYKVDEYYRFAIHFAMIDKNEQDVAHYLHKHQLLSELLEDDYLKSVHAINKAEVAIWFEHDPAKAIDVINESETYVSKDSPLKILFHYIRGQALYELNRFKEALTYLPSMEDISFRVHAPDLSMITTTNAYKALCYKHLGDEKKAKLYVQTAKESILSQPYAIDYHKTFILQAYADIFEET
ncbi:helix-turn-helix domain-containing protein [Alkalihalobacillus sp. LMS6]|uniref:helix-turn-helix domain-containing protein n=1 Tax=Bacillaceae TaxID=186817 RepID=UPI000C073F6D|nr:MULTISPECIES: helix-turn-helix transcriptional regulator [Bacillaceae]UTR07586.1 helix-turn-helix domain-containing protein [Alkalihalobacillus sp. LMS6]